MYTGSGCLYSVQHMYVAQGMDKFVGLVILAV